MLLRTVTFSNSLDEARKYNRKICPIVTYMVLTPLHRKITEDTKSSIHVDIST